MTQKELDALRGKKSVKPLFELTGDNRRGGKDDIKPVEEVVEKPKHEKKPKNDKDVESVSKPMQKRSRKGQNLDTGVDNVSKSMQKTSTRLKTVDIIASNLDSNLDKNVQIEKKKRKKEVNLDALVDGEKPLSKKEKRLARKKAQEEEAKLYPNETKKERRARLKREKFEAEAIKRVEEAEIEESKSTKHTKGKGGNVLYDEDANKRLMEIYNNITIKKSKKQQEYDEVFRKHLKANGIVLGLHSSNTGNERFAMVGKLVEKGYAKHRGYCMDYHLYELFS